MIHITGGVKHVIRVGEGPLMCKESDLCSDREGRHIGRWNRMERREGVSRSTVAPLIDILPG